MKKIILIILFSFTLTACVSRQNYEPIIKIHKESNELVNVIILPQNYYKSIFGYFFPTDSKIQVINLTSKPLNIIWEESSFNNNPIFKDGMKYIDAGKTPAKTILFPNSNEVYNIYDSSKISYSDGWKIGGYDESDFPLKIILTVEQEGKKEIFMAEINKKILIK